MSFKMVEFWLMCFITETLVSVITVGKYSSGIFKPESVPEVCKTFNVIINKLSNLCRIMVVSPAKCVLFNWLPLNIIRICLD